MNPQPPQHQPEGGEESVAQDGRVTEEDPVTEVDVPPMSEDEAEERETGQKIWTSEKVTTLEKENEELKKALHELETRLSNQETSSRQLEERCARMETAIMQIVEFVQQQNSTIENSRASVNSLVEEVTTHRDYFQKVGMIMQVHEQHIVRSGAMTQEMAQYINALIQENQQKVQVLQA